MKLESYPEALFSYPRKRRKECEAAAQSPAMAAFERLKGCEAGP